MKPFTKFTAVAAPFDMANIDTDKIIPARYLRKLRTADAGYDPWLFYDMRFDADGREKPEFILNQVPWRNTGIIVAAANFGCGSSREGAVYAMMDWGIRAAIAPSFGDIHYANEIQNGMLPAILAEEYCAVLREQLKAKPGSTITIDLELQTITGPDGKTYQFDIEPVFKERLLKGLDDVGLVLQELPAIEAFEKRHFAKMPWIA
jgi:3-isopropylmalate/(R)-2-methylmalate dehydratase small subunit